MIRSSNPALSEKAFLDVDSGQIGAARNTANNNVMTLAGTVNKTGILLLLIVATAFYTWNIAATQGMGAVSPFIWGGAIGGLVLALITIFKKTWAPVTAPMYALVEGLFIGGISAWFEMRFPGIVIQAVGLTFGTLAALLFAYKTGLIRATENFKLGVVAATGGIFLVYLSSFILSFFNINVPFIHESGLIGIGFSLFVVVIAALNLVLDFDFIENASEQGAPKYMEWYGAFGLVVTLIWLYIEFLRLLAKLRD